MVIVDGMVIEDNRVGPKYISNILSPSIVSPLVNSTWDREEHW